MGGGGPRRLSSTTNIQGPGKGRLTQPSRHSSKRSNNNYSGSRNCTYSSYCENISGSSRRYNNGSLQQQPCSSSSSSNSRQ